MGCCETKYKAIGHFKVGQADSVTIQHKHFPFLSVDIQEFGLNTCFRQLRAKVWKWNKKKEQDTWSEISKTSGLFVAQDELRAHPQQIC